MAERDAMTTDDGAAAAKHAGDGAAPAPDELTVRWSAVVRAAIDAGLSYTGSCSAEPAADRRWQSLTCGVCGERLDLPAAEDPGWRRYGPRAMQRVVAFTVLHPAEGHG